MDFCGEVDMNRIYTDLSSCGVTFDYDEKYFVSGKCAMSCLADW